VKCLGSIFAFEDVIAGIIQRPTKPGADPRFIGVCVARKVALPLLAPEFC
jgi:hypothetical protein